MSIAIGERDLVPAETRLAKRDLDFGAEVFALEQPAVAVDPSRRRSAATTQRVALPQLSTSPPSLFQMRILRSARVARFEHDQLVAADAGAAVGDGPGERRRDLERRLARVDDHEIIAETMHLVEVAPHWARDLGSAPSPSPPSEGIMPRAANDVMQSILFSAVLDGIAALKRASGGLPNQLLRDVQAIHPNVTFADLPKELQDAIAESTRAAFTQLLKEGYAVGPRQQMQAVAADRPRARAPATIAATAAVRRAARRGATPRRPSRPEAARRPSRPRKPEGASPRG